MFYKIAHSLLNAYLHICFRIKIFGREHIPRTGGLVFCSNRASMMDPIILAMVTKRQVYYISKKELFENRFIAFVLRGLGAFPVDRGGADMAAFKMAVDLLKDGRIVGVFAQGARFKSLDAKDAKAGAALFALKSGAEIIPVAINTTYKFFSKITVNIGPAVDIAAYRDKKIKTEILNEITDKIIAEIGGLM